MQHWKNKFTNAFRGIYFGVWGQTSFAVHLLMSIAVLVVAWLLACEIWQWCALLICISLVLSLELVNSAVEFLAKGLCDEHNEHVGKSLDIASGAVLVASIFTAIVGCIIFAVQITKLFAN